MVGSLIEATTLEWKKTPQVSTATQKNKQTLECDAASESPAEHQSVTSTKQHQAAKGSISAVPNTSHVQEGVKEEKEKVT